jgi:Glycosyl transferases group 1
LKIEIVYPGDGWILDRLAKVLIERVPGAYGSQGRSQAGTDTDLCYFIHYGILGPTRAALRAAFFPHFEPPNPGYELAARSVQLCVAPCLLSQRDCRAFNPNTHLIYHGIDTQRFRPRLRVGFVGREYPSGRKGSALFERLRALPWVDLHCTQGRLAESEIPDFVNSMDCILIASRFEGGPLCFQEALASGRPVVSTEVGMVADFRHLPGVHLFPHDDFEALQAQLARLLQPRLQLREGIAAYDDALFAQAHTQLFRQQLNLPLPR